jgi:ribosomal protein S1
MTKNEITEVKDNQASQLKKILAEGDFIKIPKVGDIVKGTIIDISRSEIRLDIEGLTTGIVRGREFYDEANDYSDLKVGDMVEATVIELENENGEMELSLRFAGHQKAWDNLSELRTGGQIVKALITDANRGGLMVKVGKISGFLPVSQLMPEHYPRVPGGEKSKILERLKSYIGKEFEVKVIDVVESEDKLIVSEKASWEEKQKEVIASYKVGDVVEGKVTAVTDFGVFVEFGQDKLEGLVHISELAWQRIDDPSDLVKVGDIIKAEIINVEGSKIFLSIKKLKNDPWKNVEDKYKVGQVVKGKILKINPFGLFVELDPDIHGLAHISELSDKPITDAREFAKIGDVIDLKILSIEPANHRLGLSAKALKEKSVKADNVSKPTSDESSTKKGEESINN